LIAFKFNGNGALSRAFWQSPAVERWRSADTKRSGVSRRRETAV
jgi:hypothetical protein